MAAALAVLPWILFSSLVAADDAPFAVVVRGAVFDPAGKPVAEAAVAILSSVDETPETRIPSVLATGKTAADGTFEIPLAEAPNALRVRIAKAPYEPSLVDRVEPTSTDVEVGSVGLAEGVALEGVVVDRDGKPVLGETVLARSAVDVGPWEWKTNGVRTAVTDADGRFRFERLPKAPLELGVTRLGMHPLIRRGLDLRAPNTSPVRLILEPAAPPSEFVVIGGDGKPLPGATLIQTSSAGFVPFFLATLQMTSDAEGRLRIPLPLERGVSVEVSAPGHATRTLNELPKDGRILLAKGRLASVRLVATDGTSLPMQEVRIESYTRAGTGWERVETRIRSPLADATDAAAWITTLPIAESVRVSVQSRDGEQLAPVEFTASALIGDGKTTEALRVDVPRGAPLLIEGVVKNPAGEPLVGERIELQRASPVAGQRRPFRAVKSGDGGRFRFDAVPAGAYVAQGLAPGAASLPVAANADKAAATAPVELRMETWRRGVVTVREGEKPPVLPCVVDVRHYEGNTREGAFVVLATARTDADGKATFATLPASELLVVVHAPPDVALWTFRNDLAELPRPEFKYGWKDRLKPGESASTAVDRPVVAHSWILANVTENGAPTAGASVAAILERDPVATATTGPEGRVALRVHGSGTYRLRVERGPLRAESSADVSSAADVHVDLALGVGAVSGRVVNRAGAGIDRLRIALERQDAAGAFGAAVELVTAADGKFELPTVAVGTYRVVTADPQHGYAVAATAPFTVAAAGHVTLPDLAAPPAASVHVKLTTAAGTRVPFATITVTGVDAPLPHPIEAWCAEGKADVKGLPPGKVQVAVKVHGAFTSPEPVVLDVPEGGIADVEFSTAKA